MCIEVKLVRYIMKSRLSSWEQMWLDGKWLVQLRFHEPLGKMVYFYGGTRGDASG